MVRQKSFEIFIVEIQSIFKAGDCQIELKFYQKIVI